MKNLNPKILFLLFGFAILFALIGIAIAIFGAAKNNIIVIITGGLISLFSLVISVYSKIQLKKIIKLRYENITKKVEKHFNDIKNLTENIYTKSVLKIQDGQKTNPGNGKEQ